MRKDQIAGTLLVCGLLASAPVSAGGGSENALLIIDPLSADSLYVANYYRAARDIPSDSVIYMNPGASGFTAFRQINLPALFGKLENSRSADLIDYVIVMPGSGFFINAPGLVTDNCSPVTRFSLSGIYNMAFVADEVAAGTTVGLQHRYYTNMSDPNLTRAFDSETAYFNGEPSTSTSARRYFIGAMLGHTGQNGNTLDEIFDMIDRSVAADGSRPAGTFYFMNNTADPARNVRAVQFPTVVSNMTALGASAVQVTGGLPSNQQNCLGVLTGAAVIDLVANNVGILDGAFGDHLTSFAATFDDNSQTKVSHWIRNGASGSWGEVQEPCNYTGKFPHSRMHMFYFQGLSLGEAVMRSIAFVPFQGLLYGDPLTQPFAYIPQVSATGTPLSPINGSFTLTPTASTQKPGVGIDGYELVIDGRSRGLADFGQSFTVDTTCLSDGWHDLRVLAYEDSKIRTVGRWLQPIIVNNLGRSASSSTVVGSGNLTTNFLINVSSEGAGVQEIRLTQNGRVVAASATSPAQLNVFGATLGAGPVVLHAEALFADGQRVRSGPILLDIQPTSGTPSGQPPVAVSFTKRVLDHSPFAVELPMISDTLGGNPTFTIVTPPAKATIPAGQSGASRVMIPGANAIGTDSFVYSITNANGTSNLATVTLIYDNCPDLTADGRVDQQDLNVLLAAFGTCTGQPGYSVEVDLDLSGCIDQPDLNVLLAKFGGKCF